MLLIALTFPDNNMQMITLTEETFLGGQRQAQNLLSFLLQLYNNNN
jgi:hypothetical protein